MVIGAHLDSVAAGPGINDNGSGTATILEIALQLRKLGITTPNRLRFAFFGAEEWGLLGSTHYVGALTPEELDKIVLNLNFDMLGSPNPVSFVYDGDGSATGPVGPPGSGEIEAVFLDYMQAGNLPTRPTAFDGRSDYGPFIAKGIPAGGLFTGAEGLKTEAEAADFGGTAGEAYDKCYHQACDDLANVSEPALDALSDAAAHAVLHFGTELPVPVLTAFQPAPAGLGGAARSLPFRARVRSRTIPTAAVSLMAVGRTCRGSAPPAATPLRNGYARTIAARCRGELRYSLPRLPTSAGARARGASCPADWQRGLDVAARLTIKPVLKAASHFQPLSSRFPAHKPP